MAAMFLAGLWHGASWTYILWGCYNGVLLLLERAFPLPIWLRKPAWRPLLIATTFSAVCFGLIFVRSQSFGDAETVLARLTLPVAGSTLDSSLAAAAGVCLVALFVGHLAGRC